MKQSLLEELELKHCQNVRELDRQFRTLIKKYHPDRNMHNTRWANQKSQSLINAYHKLKPILKSPSSTRPTYKKNAPFKPSAGSVSPVSFQILSGQIQYAIPVDSIHKIIFAKSHLQQVKELLWIKKLYSHSCDPEYDLFERLHQSDFKYFIILNPLQKKRALAISKGVQINNIKNIDMQTCHIFPTLDRSGVYINTQASTFFCPADLAFAEFTKSA